MNTIRSPLAVVPLCRVRLNLQSAATLCLCHRPQTGDSGLLYRQLRASPGLAVNRMIKACHIQNFAI